MDREPSSRRVNPHASGTVTMNPENLERSASGLLASILAEGHWLPGLENLATHMGVLGGGIARITFPTMFALPSSGVRHQFEDFRDGKSPTLTRATPLNPAFQDGFVAEHMRIGEEILRRDVFYQEFLRPRGCSHHISALLDTGPGGMVNFLAFRPEEDGAFQAEELAAYDRILPYLRAAALVVRGTLDAEARRRAEPFERRGEPVVRIGHDGLVMEMNPAAERFRGALFDIVARRLVTRAPQDGKRLREMVADAIERGKPGLMTLAGDFGSGRSMALAVPIMGQARDVFGTTAALVVFLDDGRAWTPDEVALSLLRDACGLTPREIDVIRLVVGGIAPRDAAARLGIAFNTARLHLKSAFAKCGVHSQAELAALIRRLS